MLLLVAVYTSYVAVAFWAAALTNWIAIPLLAIVLAQHSSLQHEVMHGHPFRNQASSDLTVFLAIGLFIPYARFRQLHRRHHCDPNLTDPYDDPETNYLDPAAWARAGPLKRALYRVNNTLLGRMVIGPALSLFDFYRSEIRQLAAGNRAIWRAWAMHALGVLPVAVWVLAVSTMPAWAYLVAAYCGISLLKIRTFAEHRAHRHTAGRTVIIEDRGPLALLFLNNNLHAVHHDHPRIAWYRLPQVYRARKQEFQARNLGYCYRNYGELFGRFLLSAKDPVEHPLMTGYELQAMKIRHEQFDGTEPANKAMKPPVRSETANQSAHV